MSKSQERFGDMLQKIMQRLNPLRGSRVSTIIADNSICLSNYNYHVCLIWFSSISNRVYFMAIPPSNRCWHVFPCSGNDTNTVHVCTQKFDILETLFFPWNSDFPLIDLLSFRGSTCTLERLCLRWSFAL